MPQIGRFWGIDPADQFPSSYTGMGNDPANMIDPTGMKAQVGYGQEVNYMHDLYAPKDQGSGGGSGSQRYAEDWDYEMEWNLAMEWKEKQDKDKKGDNEPSTDGGDNGGMDVTGINLLGTLESALSSTPGMSATSDNPMNGPLYASAGDGDVKSSTTANAIMTTTLAAGLATAELPPISAGVLVVGGAIAGAAYLSDKLPSMGDITKGMIGVAYPLIERMFSKGKGERNKTAKPDGTSNPYKHMKPDPKNPNKVILKDPHTGKPISKPKPPGFNDYWNNKR